MRSRARGRRRRRAGWRGGVPSSPVRARSHPQVRRLPRPSRRRGSCRGRGGDQLLVRALLDDPAVLEHDDQVGVAIVESRCAITNAVRLTSSFRSACSIRRSVPMSTDEVASSRMRIRGSARRARAKADELLTEREPRAALAELRLVAVLELGDEPVGADRLGRRFDLVPSGVGAPGTQCSPRRCRRRETPPAARSRAGGGGSAASPGGGRPRRS